MGMFSPKDDGRRDRWDTLKQTVLLGIQQFKRTGAALKEIRDDELYKFEYTTFAQCCSTAWKISDRHADRLIAAATFVEELGPVGLIVESERQVRALKTLPREEQIEVLSELQDTGATPAAFAKAIAKRKPKKKNGSLKPLRLRVPGGSVVITPNRKAADYLPLLHHAITMIEGQQRDAA